MKLLALPFALATVGITAAGRQPAIQVPPDTDIYLASLARNGAGLSVGQPVNVTHTPGYDNQPSFTHDGRAILFTSARGSTSGETDIYRYDIASRQVTRVTNTPEREYSPTVMPGGRRMSVVRVEADGTQRLWTFTLEGRDPSLLLADIEPVGYHAWIDETTVALYVLGQPATLRIASTTSGRAQTIARGVGRSLQRIPGGTISFVQRDEQQGTPVFTIMQLAQKDGGYEPSMLVQPPAQAAEPDVAWTPDGMLLTASGGALFGWRRGDAAWRRLADLTALGLTDVSRLAVSPSGDRLALVARP